MATSERDRISVDLRGLRAALFAQARARGVSPSDFVRQAVARSIDGGARVHDKTQASDERAPQERVRLSLRLSGDELRAVHVGASAAGLPVGRYVTDLVAGVPLLTQGGNQHDHLAGLIASTAEMATLRRSLHHLTVLLGEGNVEPALQYAAMLKSLDHDVRAHLVLAARVLSQLRPSRPAEASHRNADLQQRDDHGP